jgi:hypothetical protein
MEIKKLFDISNELLVVKIVWYFRIIRHLSEFYSCRICMETCVIQIEIRSTMFRVICFCWRSRTPFSFPVRPVFRFIAPGAAGRSGGMP